MAEEQDIKKYDFTIFLADNTDRKFVTSCLHEIKDILLEHQEEMCGCKIEKVKVKTNDGNKKHTV